MSAQSDRRTLLAAGAAGLLLSAAPSRADPGHPSGTCPKGGPARGCSESYAKLPDRPDWDGELGIARVVERPQAGAN